MNKKLLVFLFILFSISGLKAQVSSINPNTGLKNQTLTTTITMASGLMINSSAPYQFNDIYLQQGATIIYGTLVNWPSYFDFSLMRNVYADSGTVSFSIPGNVPNGYYDVNVNTYPFATPVLNTLVNGFFIGSPAGKIAGHLFFDANLNGVNDIGELPVGNQRILVAPTNDIAFTNPNGDYTYYADSGVYTVDYQPSPTFAQTTVPLTYTDTVPPSVIGRNFGTYSSSHTYDNSSFVVRTRYRCNESSRLLVELTNLGFLPVRHVATITTNNFPYVSSTIAPDFINGSSRTWIIDTLGGGESTLVGGIMFYQAPAAWNWVDIQLVDSVFDMSGALLEVIRDDYNSNVRCSYDPNDKHVSPEGVLAQNYTPITSPLTFHINFQNTGNDTAYDVTILDTLDSDLDLATLQILGSSHDVSTQMTVNGDVRFNFFNIMLPDSGTDEPGSHGWVTYRISPKTGIADPTVITNTSYIVFDQNAPVVTNTTLSTLTALQYPDANFTTADQTICETDCILFTNQSISGTSYAWSFAGGNPATSTSATPAAICYSTSGTYDVTLITTNALGSDTLTQVAYINVAPSPGVFSVVQVGDSLIAPQGFNSYQWYYNNVLISGANSYFYVATIDGDYGIVVGNANGCQSGVNVPNVTIGIDDISFGNAISVYPNPSTGSFEVSYNSTGVQNSSIQLFDKVGQLIKDENVQSVNGLNKFTMKADELSSGIYMLRVTTNSKVMTKMIVINK
jgi:PKD repeat protein